MKSTFFLDQFMIREISSQTNDCLYAEQVPNNGLMTCNYDQEKRLAAAKYYEKLANGENIKTSVNMSFGSEGENSSIIETIDGEMVKASLNDFLADGTCVVSGYVS